MSLWCLHVWVSNYHYGFGKLNNLIVPLNMHYLLFVMLLSVGQCAYLVFGICFATWDMKVNGKLWSFQLLHLFSCPMWMIGSYAWGSSCIFLCLAFFSLYMWVFLLLVLLIRTWCNNTTSHGWCNHGGYIQVHTCLPLWVHYPWIAHILKYTWILCNLL